MALREGCQINFLIQPAACISDNAPVDQEQLEVAATFVYELFELKIVQQMNEGKEVLTNSPLLTIPKEGQGDQWRVIIDMVQDGHNYVLAQIHGCC
jgi:hypothetical protein